MWDGFFLLLVLSTVMAIASFLAGMLPLSLSLSSRQLRLITAIGTGVLVGTSLIVIIPEGIETLYSASESGGRGHADVHTKRIDFQPAGVRGAGVAQMHTLHRADLIDVTNLQGREAMSIEIPRSPSPKDEVANEAPKLIKPPDEDEDEGSDTPPKAEQNEKEPSEPHAYIGLALILGFILMYLVDVLPHTSVQFLSSRRRRPSRPLHISLSSLHRGAHDATISSPTSSPALAAAAVDDDDDDDDEPAHPSARRPASPPSTTTLGLVIHAIADGIALGASTASASANPTGPAQNLGLVVFLALMLHKAPAAFGLTAVLLKQGLSTRAARAHLVVFALAAPVGAFATWVAVNVLGGAASSSSSKLGGSGGGSGGAAAAADGADSGIDRGAWWTGVVLIFSGGTFLYVAMHSMQESGMARHRHGHRYGASSGRVGHGGELDGGTNGYLGNPYAGPVEYASGRGARAKEEAPGLAETIAVVLGMLFPLVVQVGHVH